MKTKIFLIFSLLSFIIITGCIDETAKTQYVCSDGTTKESPEDCPKPSPFEKISGFPSSIEISLLQGESKKLEYTITNFNSKAIDLYFDYTIFDSSYQPTTYIDWSNPNKKNYQYNIKSINDFTSGETRIMVLNIDTDKSTITGFYEKNISIYNNEFKKIIPLKIIVHN